MKISGICVRNANAKAALTIPGFYKINVNSSKLAYSGSRRVAAHDDRVVMQRGDVLLGLKQVEGTWYFLSPDEIRQAMNA